MRTINNLIAEKFGLKSNMDRFIELVTATLYFNELRLKSNMDRFIDAVSTEPSPRKKV